MLGQEAAMIPHPTQSGTIFYPESDGEPVGETDVHRRLMFDLIFALTNWLGQTIAYVAGNLFIYYEEGNPAAAIAPDVFVIFGVPQTDRRTYKIWENNGKTPIWLSSSHPPKHDTRISATSVSSMPN